MIANVFICILQTEAFGESVFGMESVRVGAEIGQGPNVAEESGGVVLQLAAQTDHNSWRDRSS